MFGVIVDGKEYCYSSLDDAAINYLFTKRTSGFTGYSVMTTKKVEDRASALRAIRGSQCCYGRHSCK